MEVELGRRSFLEGIGIAPLVVPFLAGSSQALGDSVQQLESVKRANRSTFPNMVSPIDHVRANLRMIASLDEEDCPWWYNGTVYAVVGEEQPVPLLNVEGMEVYRASLIGEDAYELTGNTVTFYRDFVSNEMLYEFFNPYTERKIEVPPAVQSAGPGRGFTYEASGIRPTSFRDELPDDPPKFLWHEAGEFVWMHSSRVYPPGMSTPRAERQSVFANSGSFHDLSINKLMSCFSSTFFSPWMKWLDMDGRPGHVIWHAGGAKLESFEGLHSEYRERVEREFPESLTGKPPAGSGGKKVE